MRGSKAVIACAVVALWAAPWPAWAEVQSDERPAGRASVQELADRRQQALALDAQAIASRSAELNALAQADAAAADPLNFQMPTAGGVGSGFGMRLHPILHFTRLHNGQDIGGVCGQPVNAAQAGVVVTAATGWNGGAGNNVRVDHGVIAGHDIQTGYLHMASYVVKPGDRLTKGQLIGYVGSTGLSTACHLHFSAYQDGTGVDPALFLHNATPVTLTAAEIAAASSHAAQAGQEAPVVVPVPKASVIVPTPSASTTPKPSVTPSATSTPSASVTPSASATAPSTPSPSATTPATSPTPTPSDSATAKESASPTPSG